MSLTSGIQLAPLAVEIIGNASKLMTTIDKSTTAATNKAEIAGKRLTSIGAKMTVGITAPIATAATALGGMAVSFESNFAKVSTLLDSSTVDYNQYKESIIEGSNKMKTSVADYSEAVYQSISAGVDQSKAIEFTNNAIKLAKGGFTDAASAVDILTTVINAYSLSTDEATRVSDLLVNTQNLGKTTVNELASAMGRVIPTAKNAGVNIDNVCTAMAVMTKNGIATAEATTYYNSMLNELASSGTTADKTLRELSGTGFAGLMQQGKGVTEILSMLQGEAQKSGQSLGDMFGSSEAAKAALTIMKNDGTEYNDILNQMATSAGATEEAFKKIDSTPAERLAGAWNKLKNSGIELGDSLIPLIEKGADAVSDLADWLGSLSEEEQESILKTAGFVAAMGPVLTVTGKGISTISSLTKTFKGLGTASTIASGVSTASKASGLCGIASSLGSILSSAGPAVAVVGTVGAGLYLAHENAEYFNTSLSTTSEELSFVQKCFNELDGGVFKSKKEMIELGLVYEDWTDNVSKDLQKSVDDTAGKFANLNFEVQRLTDNNIVIDEGTKNNLINQTTEICDGIVTEIQAHSDEGQKALKDVFGANGKQDWYEDTVLKAISGDTEEAVKEIQSKKDEIIKIIENAYSKNRELGESEKVAIEELYAEIGDIKVRSLADNQDELLEAQAQFNVKCRALDEKGMSELMQSKAKDRDKNIKETQEYYDTQIEKLSMNLNNMNTTERIAAEAAIRDLQEERDKKVSIQQDQYKSYLDTIEREYPEIYERINWHTGKIMNAKEKSLQDLLIKEQSYYQDLDKITETGTYNLYNKQTKAYEDVCVKVDESTGRIIGMWNTQSNEVYGCTEKIINDMQKMGSKYETTRSDIVNDINTLIGSNKTYSSEMKNAAKSIVGDLESITSAEGGTYKGILTLNGEKVEVKVNSDGTIANLQAIINKMNSIDKNPVITYSIKAVTDGLASGLNLATGYHYNGLTNVPYDGYTARLHKGERVLTAKEADNYNQTLNNNSQIINNFNGNYNFNDKSDIDYFLNQAALKIKGARG